MATPHCACIWPKGRWPLVPAAEGKIDSVPWARMALQMGKPLIAAADDPWTKLALQWELGVALSDGLAADELRGAVQHAMPNTALTITYFEAGAKGRRETPDDAFPPGLAVLSPWARCTRCRRSDHKTAVAWYEKAYPLLDRPIPPTSRNAARPLRRMAGEHGHFVLGNWQCTISPCN